MAFIDGAVCPVHFTIAMAFIVYVAPQVDVSALPGEGSSPILFVELVLAFEAVALGVVGYLPPLALAVFHAVLELPCVDASVFPLVDPLAFRLAVRVLTRVQVSVGEEICALPTLEALVPRAFIAVSILPLMHAVAVSLAVFPLAHVRVSEDALPHPVAVLDSVLPLSVVHFTVCPVVHSFSVGFPVLEVPFVSVAIGVAFVALA
mmetsp:Transcript_29483/g.44761  ORF Transcript_29483/g.44761 Transcript_29483/m.44761 type:complete len:205 (-) Transcript_29483:1073-1687(-)